MSTWLIGLLVIALVLIFLSRKKTGQKKPDRGRSTVSRTSSVAPGKKIGVEVERASDSYKGCQIQPGIRETACTAVLAKAEETFEVDNAPQLPLSDCDAAHCECHYVQVEGRRHINRRKGEDRRDDIRVSDDRREGKDRRTDANTWKNTL